MTADSQLTFAEHIRELRGRLMWSLLFVLIGAGIGYGLHDILLTVLQRPLHDTLYYSTPTGAFSFIIKICITFGMITALPMVIYQTFSFFGPLIKAKTRRQFVGYVVMSFLLAGTGIVFAYLVSLPAALNFLVNFGTGKGDIQALITADEYFNFVLTYIAGFAVMFQLPLIITFINRVKPMQPKKLIGHTRYVILGSFLVAAIITPTPDPFNQFIMAAPIVLLYFVSVVIVAMTNARARKKARKIYSLTPHIATKTIDAILESLPPMPVKLPQMMPAPVAMAHAKVEPIATISRPVSRPRPAANRRLMQDMVVRPIQPKRAATVTPVRPQTQRAALQPARPNRMTFQSSPRLISDFMTLAK